MLTRENHVRRPPMHVNISKPCKSLPAAMVGTRSRGSRRRLSDKDLRCSASDRRWFPARPARQVHRRRNSGKGQIPSALASAHGRNGEKRGETCNAGRAGAYDPRRRCTRHDHRTCCGSRGSASLPCPRCGNASKCATPDRAERVPTIGMDLIPYVDAHGRPPDQCDDLIAG